MALQGPLQVLLLVLVQRPVCWLPARPWLPSPLCPGAPQGRQQRCRRAQHQTDACARCWTHERWNQRHLGPLMSARARAAAAGPARAPTSPLAVEPAGHAEAVAVTHERAPGPWMMLKPLRLHA